MKTKTKKILGWLIYATPIVAVLTVGFVKAPVYMAISLVAVAVIIGLMTIGLRMAIPEEK